MRKRFQVRRLPGFASLLLITGLLSFGSLARTNRSALADKGKGGEIITKPKLTPSPKATPRTKPPVEKTKSQPAKFTNQYRMEFVMVPAGKFMMGSADGDTDEKPIHGVTIGRAFYLGRYEVTQYQWRAVMGRTVSEQKRLIDQNNSVAPRRRLAGEGDEYPMYYLSWQDAHTFLQRLNALNDGYIYRLPSEAEWEYACRAGGSADAHFDLNPIAWYRTNSNDSTQPVGMRRANAFGLYDMLGNVWEWCEDWFHSNYEGAPTDGAAWLTPGEVQERSSRGGSFSTGNPTFLRCTARGGQTPDNRDFETGFRVVAEKH